MAISSSQVGWLFVQQYYTFLNESPERLHLFYNSNSTLEHGTEGENTVPVIGQEKIKIAIKDYNFTDCQVFVSSVDSQASLNGGVVVQVLGELSNNRDLGKSLSHLITRQVFDNSDCIGHKFCQTFFLAEQTEGYYVLNDIFRYLKEEVDQSFENDSSLPVFNYQADGAPLQQTNHSPKVEPKKQNAPNGDKVGPHGQGEKNGSQKNGVPPVKQTQPQPQPAQTKPVQSQAQKPVVADVLEESKDLKQIPKKTLVKTPQPDLKPVKPKSPTSVETTAVVEEFKQEDKTGSTGKKNAEKVSEAPKAWNKVASAGPTPVPIATPSPPKPVQVHPTPQPTKPNPKKSQPILTPIRKDETDGFVEVIRKNEKKQVEVRGENEKDKATVVVRNLPDATTRTILGTSFEVFGPVANVDMTNTKIAFITFRAVETATAAIGRTVVLAGVDVVVEERGKYASQRRGGRGGAGYRGNGRGGRGRGEKA